MCTDMPAAHAADDIEKLGLSLPRSPVQHSRVMRREDSLFHTRFSVLLGVYFVAREGPGSRHFPTPMDGF
jgi:hypothetical protein